MSQLGQSPEKAQSGSFLHAGSTPGSKIAYIDNIAIGSAILALTAGGHGTISADIDIYDPAIPEALRTDENIKSWYNAAVWPYFDIFVDNDANFNYFVGAGGSLSADQTLVKYQWVNLITPTDGKTHTLYMTFYNGGASPHTIYFYVGAKYVITG